MFPTEKTFSPVPFYFHFTSAVVSSLHKAVSRLHAAGFLRVFQASEDFRDNLIALSNGKLLAARYVNERTYEDLQNNRLKENLIILANFKSVLYAVLIIILSSNIAFVAEVCMFHHTNVKQVVTVWAIKGFEILLCLLKVTNRSFIVVRVRVASAAVVVCTKVPCKLHKTDVVDS